MAEVVYRSEIHITRERGPLRYARVPGKDDEVAFGVHGAVAEHYGVDMGTFAANATTLDYVMASTAG